MVANMWKNSLKNVESDNKILYETLLDFFLQQNSTYFLNEPRIKLQPSHLMNHLCTATNKFYNICRYFMDKF